MWGYAALPCLQEFCPIFRTLSIAVERYRTYELGTLEFFMANPYIQTNDYSHLYSLTRQKVDVS